MKKKKTGFKNIFVQPYENDLRIYKKAKLLVPVVFSIAVLALILAGLMLITGAVQVAVILAALVLFCVLTLLLMAKSRYLLASGLFLYTLFLVMFAAIKFDAYKNIYEIYVFGTLGSFLLITSCLIAAKPIQAWILTILNLAAAYALYIMDSLPLDNGTVTELAIQSLGTSTILLIAGGIFSASTIKLQAVLVAETEKASTESENQYIQMVKAIDQAQTAAMGIGTSLSSTAVTLIDSAQELRITAQNEITGIKALEAALDAAEKGQSLANAAQSAMQESITQYSSSVMEASASITEMLSALDSIASQTLEREEAIGSLVSKAKEGEERILAITEAVSALLSVTEKMEEMNNLITEVAERTNLLGMNAAIEAAHAGAAGKGFAVVAEEIRNLSETTSEGTASIAALLSETAKVVNTASRASSETSSFFSQMTHEIIKVSTVLKELLEKVKELSMGTSSISRAIDSFGSLSNSTDRVMEKTRSSFLEASSKAAASRTIASDLHKAALLLDASCDAIQAQSEALFELGEKNLSSIQELRTKLDERGKTSLA
ncbi:hypothetical protein MASR2M29_06770 [Spirochaetota bacterium]